MKQLFVFLCFLLAFLNLHAQKIAVMQFDAGSGVNQEEVNGISNMFLTFFNPDGYIIIERIEVDRVITELNFQKGNLTEKEMAEIGEILNLQYLVLGDINWVQNQYNVDTRVIDVATARIIATSGMTFNGGVTFRENIQKIAEDLARKISSAGKGISSTNNTPNQQEVSILYGYLKVFPNDLGFFEQPPKTVISRINSFSQYGYNTWRIPTSEEVALMRAAALIGSDDYMVSESTKAGNVRLVTDQGTAEEVEAEKKAAAEKQRIEQEKRDRLAEQRRIEEQKKLEEQREQRAKEEAKEQEFKSSLTSWEKAYLGGLSLGYELKAVEYLKQGYPNGRGVYPGHVWTETLESNRDYDRYGYDFYLEISKNPDVNAYLLTKPEWFCAEIYDNSVYTTTYFSSPETIYLSRSKGKSYIHVLQSDDYENYTISRSDAARKPIMLGKRISSSEASRLISDFKTQRYAQIESENKAKIEEQIGLINHYLTTGTEPDRLFTLLHDAQKNDPNNASLYYVEGDAYKKLGDFDKALELYAKSSEVDPKYLYGVLNTAILYYDRAVEIQEKASLEMDDAKYNKMVEELNANLEKAIDPFEKSFSMTEDKQIKTAIADYLKNIYYRFRDRSAEYQANYEKYNNFLKGE